LNSYRFITHSASSDGSFYFNPRRDVVCLSFDFTNEDHYIRDINHCYGEQLTAVEIFIVEEWIWDMWKPAGFTSKFLVPFGALKTILHLLDDGEENNRLTFDSPKRCKRSSKYRVLVY
jgi:hypothetical protein